MKLRYDLKTLEQMSIALGSIAFKMRQHLSAYAKKNLVKQLNDFADKYEFVNKNWANQIVLCASMLEDAKDFADVNRVDMQICEVQKDIRAARGN